MAPGKKVQMAAAPPIVPELAQSLPFSVNSLEGRAPQVIHGQNVLTMLLATFSGTNANALITMNTNQIPLCQVLILSASHQGMAFSFPEH